MLIRLARTYLAPYKQLLVYVVLLQFVGTLGALYLPKLNADIIDKGVVTGDTSYIIRTGGVMLAVAQEAGLAKPEYAARAYDLARELGPEYEREVIHRDDLVVL